ncbi:nucleotidyltransferase domain-containing protein [Bacillus xiapuensis]|uniref:Nucleotidyltransferase domain-containing protein n=1 Tax=Bacillus xiapuensis TaxID=2014075 RepID=A0ABU6NA49_9BACI|nr:nucleotidyltransferase domain-containing protein [Bacillus xiapuensis]
MNETVLFDKVSKYLIQKYNCHTIILYGSYSRGDLTEESELDIVCFSDKTDNKRRSKGYLQRHFIF